MKVFVPSGEVLERIPCSKYGATFPLNTNFNVSPWFVANGDTATGSEVRSGGIWERACFRPCVSFHPTQLVTYATPSRPSPLSPLGQEGWE